MKKNVILVVLSGVIAVLPIGKASGFGTTLFFDDFESYSVGTFPSAGGWILVWDGRGPQYQVVTDAYSFSPTKSLQLWGRPNWASVAQRKFPTDATVIGYECAIRIDSIGTGGPGREESVGFFNRDVYIWGRSYARVIFYHDDGKIKAEDGTILGDWVTGVWYQVKVVLDRSTNTYTVWIDGQLRGEGCHTYSTDTHNINALALPSGHPGVKVYYDDVRVFEVEARKASDPYPADSAIDVPTDVVLSWTPGVIAASHDVYFGTSSPPRFIRNQTARSYDPGTLEPGTNYYWQINEVEADGATIHIGNVWSFTTVCIRKATNPYPANDVTNVDPNVVLSWTPGCGATSHDVYFGTDLEDVQSADQSSPEYVGRLSGDASTYEPGSLELCTGYYWRIDTVPCPGCPVTQGPVWDMRTTCEIPAPIGDINGDCRVDFRDLAILANNWLAEGTGPCAEEKVNKCCYRLQEISALNVNESQMPAIALGAKCVANACLDPDGSDCDPNIINIYIVGPIDPPDAPPNYVPAYYKLTWQYEACRETRIERDCRNPLP